jgi:hypothetical protein
MVPACAAGQRPSGGSRRRILSSLVHLLVLLLLPALALVQLGPRVLGHRPPGEGPFPTGLSDEVPRGPFLVSDLRDFITVSKVQEDRLIGRGAAGIEGQRPGASPNGPGREEPLSLRFTYTFDYWWGFGY